MSYKFYSKLSRLWRRCSNRLLSWVLRISNYKMPMPNYKQVSVKDNQCLEVLSHNPAYKDLCLWLVAHRDRAVRRLISSNGEDYRELIGQVNAYEQIYNEVYRELVRNRNSEE
jgi:hypothetical protein